jgi:hypothetical protein
LNDTTPEVARLVQQRYALMSPAERFMIGVQMFETARIMALASFPAGLTDREQRVRLCERLYGRLASEAYGAGGDKDR